MEDIIKEDILDVLSKAVGFVKKNDADALSELSNHTIHDASIFQSSDPVSVAVLVYALSRIMARALEQQAGWHKKEILEMLLSAKKHLEKDRTGQYRKTISGLIAKVKTIDKKFPAYIKHILDRAKIKKAGKMHEHGISIARTAELLNLTQWELMDYIGKTVIPEKFPETPAAKRLSRARSLFK